ncbi:hypothetical protein [Amycolatopsis sp. cg9]|uniref:hypothetical protein n=1 Tax=Amycolatopsis sp. cg9 TaxID=3238801 RepID=UPI0035245679
MKPFRRRRRSPYAPEAEAVIAGAQMTGRALADATAEFVRIYGQEPSPETIHVPSERGDLPQLETASRPAPAETDAEQAQPTAGTESEGR